MSSTSFIARKDIHPTNSIFSNIRTTVETFFYGNNVTAVNTLAEAYQWGQKAPGTVTSDLPILHTTELGLPEGAKVLVANSGTITGRTAAARRIIGQPGIDSNYYAGILREAVFASSLKPFLKGDAVVGLAEDFMVKAHLTLPEKYAMNVYSWMLNFQVMNDTYQKMYAESKVYPEGDIFVYGDPDWTHPDFPQGLALFDPEHNVAAILGLRYFGEYKKSSLTLAWGIAHRNGYIACHGGMKQYDLGTKKFTMAAFGLSGSGKSTITLAKQKGKDNVTVLHDDAFIIDKETGATTALEPAYFDKTQDYPMDNPAVNYFLTVQNVGVTLDEKGQKVLVTEDIRNGNGRTVKSRYVTDNRVDHLGERIDAVFWIMKDDTLPPVVKIDDPVLAAVFGATLATKRSTAENLAKGTNLDKLVMEPFANPFRCYALGEDYQDFRNLFAGGKTACYILNTGFFNGEKVTKEQTLGSVEKIATNAAEFVPFGNLSHLSYLPLAGHTVDFSDQAYLERLTSRMESRLAFIQEQAQQLAGFHALPKEAGALVEKMIVEIAENK
ncbi:phosphoenolpyruvate carboxykinase (ATP) [Enterococcus nangangensis]|uniref:phosphoenolpyruvate carboxykinase (ATP) n=1 Tax=Enterococcus nangangensis TaxID=2559926 RepID=UPI0010F7A0B1|nr:phosphoenolpyruvate carboxykinase (ATP) [Enterococcus nangangensis]